MMLALLYFSLAIVALSTKSKHSSAAKHTSAAAYQVSYRKDDFQERSCDLIRVRIYHGHPVKYGKNEMGTVSV